MKNYKITIQIDLPEYNGEVTSNWDGYGEQGAISQAFLFYTQCGARSLQVIDIIEN